jgi:hypothetical protein
VNLVVKTHLKDTITAWFWLTLGVPKIFRKDDSSAKILLGIEDG